MFEVDITHDDTVGRVDCITFRGAEFSCDSKGTVRVWLDDDACMNWYRLRKAVEEEAAAEDGDHATEGDWEREMRKEPFGGE